MAGFAATAAQFVATKVGFTPWALLAYGGYAAAFAFGLAALAVTKYLDVEPRPLMETHAESPKALLLSTLIASRTAHFEANAKVVHGKAVLWWISVATLAVALLGSIIVIGESS
ncbi:hypothetical protein [Haloechinothrix salitolerans]|uniref:Uncharacterized protein n=1 Tax=Haloechinothrix salitolerans TaxID=926830 RepID=A0ABW2C005_9PSEU